MISTHKGDEWELGLLTLTNKRNHIAIRRGKAVSGEKSPKEGGNIFHESSAAWAGNKA